MSWFSEFGIINLESQSKHTISQWDEPWETAAVLLLLLLYINCIILTTCTLVYDQSTSGT